MKPVTETKPKETSKLSPLFFIGIVAIIIVVIFVAVHLFIKSSGAGYVCNSDAGGCFWQYSFFCKDCGKDKQCPKCEDFCQSKNKEEISYAGQPVSFGKQCVCECK